MTHSNMFESSANLEGSQTCCEVSTISIVFESSANLEGSQTRRFEELRREGLRVVQI